MLYNYIYLVRIYKIRKNCLSGAGQVPDILDKQSSTVLKHVINSLIVISSVYKAAVEQVTKLEKERDSHELRFVSHFHPFPFTSSSSSIWYNWTLKYFFLTNSMAQSFPWNVYTHLVKKFIAFMQPKGSLMYSQKSIIWFYPDTIYSSSHLHTILL
jgi:hypothetical protein